MMSKKKKDHDVQSVSHTYRKVTSWVIAGFVILTAGFIFTQQPVEAESSQEDLTKVVVYKSPTCGCCKKWVSHMKENGFTVESHNEQNLQPIKAQAGVPRNAQSCHTAKIGGYFIEGHVPADLVKKLLKDKPNIKGLTVPGMVMGSPGMEGFRKDHYDVLAINHDGSTSVYASR